MPVTQDYKLLTTWRDLIAARIVFFEPLGTHTSLVRELKAELKITNDLLGSTHAAVVAGDYTKLVLTIAERERVARALADDIDAIERALKVTPVNSFAARSILSDRLGAAQSAYAKVRA